MKLAIGTQHWEWKSEGSWRAEKAC